MESTESVSQASPIPEGMTEKEYVSNLIKGQYEEHDDSDQRTDQVLGQEAPEHDVRGDNSGSGAVDSEEHDPAESLENDPETPEAASADGESEPVTLGKLADHLELEAAELYEVEVPIGDGVTATLGQLKDEFKEYGPAKEFQENLNREKGDFEKQVLQTRSELNAIMQAIPEQIRGQVIQQAQQYQANWSKQQESAVLEAIPEWADSDKRAESRAHIIEDGAEYGFSEQEITHTQDARTLRWMRDFANMKRELQAMRAAAKAQPGKPGKTASSAKADSNTTRLRRLIAKGKAATDPRDKVAVVQELIRSQHG